MASLFTETPSKLGMNGKNLVEKKFVLKDQETASGKHGEVIFIQTPGKTTNFAVKRQYIRSPKNAEDKAYRELRIFKELSKLKNCKNFISMVDWFKIREPLFPEFEDEDEDEQYMHFIMEYADSTLFEMKDKLDLLQFKSVLFQILYALYIAQTELEFNHNDLHLRNILLKWTPNGEFSEFKDYDGTSWYTNSYTVKICDFGISRLTVRETKEVIYNTADSFTEVFIAEKDLRKLATELTKIRIRNWNTNTKSTLDKGGLLDEDDDEDEEEEKERQQQEKAAFTDIKRRMSKGAPIRSLLHHKFFEALKISPVSLQVEEMPENEEAEDIEEDEIPSPEVSPGTSPVHKNYLSTNTILNAPRKGKSPAPAPASPDKPVSKVASEPLSPLSQNIISKQASSQKESLRKKIPLTPAKTPTSTKKPQKKPRPQTPNKENLTDDLINQLGSMTISPAKKRSKVPEKPKMVPTIEVPQIQIEEEIARPSAISLRRKIRAPRFNR